MGKRLFYGLAGLVGVALFGVTVVSSSLYRGPREMAPEVYVEGIPTDTKVVPSGLGGTFLTDIKTDDGYVIARSLGNSQDLNAAKELIDSELVDGDEEYVKFWGYECPGYINVNSIATDGRIVNLEEKDICW